MEINDLDALAALVERMDACGCPGAYRGMKCVACVSDMNWVIAAAPDLLRLARKGLEAGKPADPIEGLRRLTRSLSYCDDCQQQACDDAKPEGPHVLCHDCAVKHKAMSAAPPPAGTERTCAQCWHQKLSSGVAYAPGTPCCDHGHALIMCESLGNFCGAFAPRREDTNG